MNNPNPTVTPQHTSELTLAAVALGEAMMTAAEALTPHQYHCITRDALLEAEYDEKGCLTVAGMKLITRHLQAAIAGVYR